jgi:hypothetical protein
VFRQRARALLAAELLSLVFLPFLGVTAARSLWAVGAVAAGPDPPPGVALAPPQSAPRGAPRVIWIVMDEFDYRLAFDERPESVALPAFDRLRGESLFATQASAPAWRTLLSMPALINGKYVAEAAPQSASELSIRFEGERESKEWSRLPNLFSRTHERGGNVAVVGFYHPYCQLFPTALSRCSVEPFLTSWGQPTLGTAMRAQWGSLLADVPALAVLGLGDLVRPWRDDPFMLGLRNSLLGLNRQLLEAARPLLGRRDLQLVLIHLAVPHPPGVFDRRTNTASISPEVNYLDNLELADQTLAELRELAEETGTWHDSTWIISSDHWWKSNFWAGEPGWTQEEARLDVGEKDQRIPFIVKLAGARDAVEYRRPLNTVLSADLIETLWSDPWSSHRELAAWLASRASP